MVTKTVPDHLGLVGGFSATFGITYGECKKALKTLTFIQLSSSLKELVSAVFETNDNVFIVYKWTAKCKIVPEVEWILAVSQ